MIESRVQEDEKKERKEGKRNAKRCRTVKDSERPTTALLEGSRLRLPNPKNSTLTTGVFQDRRVSGTRPKGMPGIRFRRFSLFSSSCSSQ